MAEASYHGRTIKAFWNTAEITNITEWSYTIAADVAESTAAHPTAHGKEREVGFLSATATITCRVIGDNQIDEGDGPLVLELLRNTTNAAKGFQGTAICTGVAVSMDINDIENVTYSFRFTNDTTPNNTVTEGSV